MGEATLCQSQASSDLSFLHFVDFFKSGKVLDICVQVCTYVCQGLWGPEALDPLEPELQAVVNHWEPNSGQSVRAVSGPNH